MMTRSEQRMELIGSTILEQAQQESAEITAAAESEYTAAIEGCRDQVIDQVYTQIQGGIAAIRKANTDRLATARKQAHRALLLRRRELEESVFAAVRARLADYTATPAYRAWMLSQAESLQDAYDHTCSTLTLRPADEAIAQELQACFPGCAVALSDSVKLGGFTLRNTAAGVLVDCTLDERLREERAWFLEHCGMKVV